jgi:hypothetical protein
MDIGREKILGIFRKTLSSPIFWILIITIILLRTILFTSGIPHNGDLTYPSTIAQYQKALFPLWNESTSDSNLESIDRGFSLILVLFVRLIGGEVDLLSKLYFFIPLFVSGVTTAYLTKFVLQKVQPNKHPNLLAIILASFMYMISPWVLEQVQAPFYWLAYAVTPGIILLAYRFFSERRLAFGLGLALLWTVAATTPHYTLFSFFLILFIWLIIFLTGSNKMSQIKPSLKLWLYLSAFFVALNAYWLVTTAFMFINGSITPGYVFTPDMLSLFSQNANWHVLSGTDQWATWWPGQYSSFINAFIYLATIALPATLIVAFWIAKKGKGNLRLFYILLGVWLIGLIFALGQNNPLYTWLATSTPLASSYGWLLRVPGKISYLLWPIYVVSTGLIVQYVYTYSTSKKALPKKMLAIITVVALIVSSNGYAVLKAQDYFNYYYAPVPIPTEYQQAFAYISNNLTDARIADLARYENGSDQNNLNYNAAGPPEPFESSYTWNPHRIAGYFVPRSIATPNIGYYHFTYSGIWRPAYTHFHDTVTYQSWFIRDGWEYCYNSSRLENISQTATAWFPVYGVNYVLYHNDIENTTIYGEYDLQTLNQTGAQLETNWGDMLYLYRVPETFGRIYTLNNSWSNITDMPPTKNDLNLSGATITDIHQVDSTLWHLNITASKPFTLVFTEGFDTYWGATITANDNSYTLGSKEIFGSINSFQINQTGNLQVTLQYKPQIWLNYGILVTLSLLVVTLICLAIRFKKQKTPYYLLFN